MKIESCPFCKRTLLNRLIDRCSYCEKDLPKEYCLTKSEKESLINKKRSQYSESKKEQAKQAIKTVRKIKDFAAVTGTYLPPIIELPQSNEK